MLLRTLPSVLRRRAFIATVTMASLAAVSLPLTMPADAQAAPPPSNGNAWGPDGTFDSDSVVTVRWDNTGNAPENTVPRERDTPLPHTAGKTYADIPARVRNSVQSLLGPDNGRGGMRMTLSQSRGLTNQTISVRLDGLADPSPDINPGGTAPDNDQFQVFQCWGALGPDGKPDPTAQAPDPSTCELGAAGWGRWATDGPTSFAQQVGGDPLLAGGDWERRGLIDQDGYLKVTGIDGSVVSGYPLTSPVINQSSTNEVSRLTVNKTGSVSAPFEVHTGAEAKFMGCGKRDDAPSTSSCWLVAVPRVGQLQLSKVASPAAWAQRLQVKLGFRDIPKPCSSTQQRLISSGSELISRSGSSWIPALCGQGQGLALAKVSDATARNQQAGGNPVAFTTRPSDGAQHVPVALSGVVIAYRAGYTNEPAPGQPRFDGAVTGLKLNARLIAKMLTSSYAQAIKNIPQPPGYVSPNFLSDDPEFRRLNPDYTFDPAKPPYLAELQNQNFNLESLNSDAAQVLWTWLGQDKAASSFLSGCPDPDGMTVQPFYSSRTYTGCESQAKTLEASASAQRAAASKVPEFVDAPQIYPPYSGAYPQVLWTQGDPVKVVDGLSFPRTLPDSYPRVDTMETAGLRTSRMLFIQNTDKWCSTAEGCQVPPPGKWTADGSKNPKEGTSSVFGVTDTATAANYQLQTALLCDDDGKKCVGADESSLTAASTTFTSEAAPQPDPAKALASGAYPLAMPVYAALKPGPKATPDVVRQIDKVITYMTGPGQKPGFGVGQLPPGYAPVTAAMKAHASCALVTFTGGKKPGCATAVPSENKPTGTSPLLPDKGRTVSGAQSLLTPLVPDAKGDDGGAKPAAEPADAAAAAGPAAPNGGKGSPEADAASPVSNGVTAVTPAAWASYGLFVLLGLALVAAIVSPVLKRLRGGGAA